MGNLERTFNRAAQRKIEKHLKENRRLKLVETEQRLGLLEEAMAQVLNALATTQVDHKPILAVDRKTAGGVLLPGRAR